MMIGVSNGSGSRFFFFQAEDGIRGLVRSRGLGDVYRRQALDAGADRFITNNARDFPKTITEIDITYPTDLPLSLIHI